jgi:ABC-type Na+ efflux pump permease subunit
MSMSGRRIRAVIRKELREYRRNRSLVVTMAIFPLIFLIQPIVAVVLLPSAVANALSHQHILLYVLGVPILVPASIAASLVAGERQQGTLEPVLTTPIRGDELLLGKALAVLLPATVITYLVDAVFAVVVVLFAQPGVAGAVLGIPDMAAQVLLAPPLAFLVTWIGIAISTRTSDIRVAQQVTVLGSLPLVFVASLVAFDAVHLTAGIATVLVAAIVVLDSVGWRLVSRLFDRERLIAGPR